MLKLLIQQKKDWNPPQRVLYLLRNVVKTTNPAKEGLKLHKIDRTRKYREVKTTNPAKEGLKRER